MQAEMFAQSLPRLTSSVNSLGPDVRDFILQEAVFGLFPLHVRTERGQTQDGTTPAIWYNLPKRKGHDPWMSPMPSV